MHVYRELGSYSVALLANNDNGYSRTIKEAYINLTDIEPEPPGVMNIYLLLLLRQSP